jgi:protein phosphatase 1G
MGEFLSSPKQKKYTSHGENSILKYAVCSMQGWRRTMEDSHLVALDLGTNKDTHIFGVFDGHGGIEVAEYVKNHFVEIFINNSKYLKGDIKSALKETFLTLDNNLQSIEAMKELTHSHEIFVKTYNLNDNENINNNDIENSDYIDNIAYNIGCTCNILVIYKNILYFANAGDSRSVLLKNKGEVNSMSIDHKPELPNEFNRIKKAGGRIIEGRVNGLLNLSRSIGDFQFKNRKDLKQEEQIVTCNPDILFENRSKNDDFVIMGCDGIWECISNTGISEYIYDKENNINNVNKNKELNLEKILEDLFERNIAKSDEEENGCDNMTAILIQFKK